MSEQSREVRIFCAPEGRDLDVQVFGRPELEPGERPKHCFGSFQVTVQKKETYVSCPGCGALINVQEL